MSLADRRELWTQLDAMGLGDWSSQLAAKSKHWFSAESHGTLPKWLEAYRELPPADNSVVDVVGGHVRVRSDGPRDADQLRNCLMQFHPWRKGPFDFLGLELDTEWRSDLKWNRLTEAIDFGGKDVIDVGCGNGYYGWRMLQAGANFVLGCDPFMLYVMQFEVVRRYAGENQRHFVLPIGDTGLPSKTNAFDLAFSMGVLYHRTSPIDHLQKMRSTLKPGGELVVETLVIGGSDQQVLMPEGRYAKMRNVWFLPTTQMLELWLRRCGFRQVETIDVTPTTLDEQRKTDWMTYESLSDFLDPDDSSLTLEGYPAPLRAIVRAIAA